MQRIGDEETLPLSLTADIFIQDAARRADESRRERGSVRAWLRILLEQAPSAAEAAASSLAISLEGVRSALESGTRDAAAPGDVRREILDRAMWRARRDRRQVVSIQDVAAALLSLASPSGSPAAAPVTGPAPSAPTARASERSIRVFVSSTFRDMGAERDELVKVAFPALRKLAESRGVAWGEVDLRWGVTDEQKADGQVLPICLDEIERCRPYFIGLLGERYGWVPDVLDPGAVEREPWIAGYPGASVTELEILHGVLRDPAMAEHGFFYLRDPAYVEGRSAEVYRELPTSQELATLGPAEAERRASARRSGLAGLKARIRASRFPVTEYRDPRSLGARVVADLTSVIEAHFPAGSSPVPLDAEAALHDAFARSRAAVYIGRPADTETLDDWAAGDGPPLLVTGVSGVGKSALLATWALGYRAAHPEVPLIVHFAGASPASADPDAMLRRLLGELRRQCGLVLEIPNAPDALRLAFANALHMAAAKGRLVLVLDALDQLDDREGAPDLAFLPPVIPESVRLLCSSLPGRAADAAAARGWPTHEVAPLELGERAALVDAYLGQSRKTLAPALRDRVVAAPGAANPLYLRVLLDELRVWGEHETLSARLDHYLAALDPAALFGLVLARWEADYERDRPGLTADAMTALWAARHGLAEAELLDLLGPGDGTPLPRAAWSPLFLAAEPALIRRGGLLGFFHDYMRRAVEHRYLPVDEAERTAHRRLADYFAARDTGLRRIAELPWQLMRAGDWDRLAATLADLPFFTAAWDVAEQDLRIAWAAVEANSSHRVVDAYRAVLDDPAAYETETVDGAARLLGDMGHHQDALRLRDYFVERHRASGDRPAMAIALLNRGIGALQSGDPDTAEAELRRAEELYRQLGDKAGLGRAFGVLGDVRYRAGRPNEASDLYIEARRLADAAGDLQGQIATLGNLAYVDFDRGDYPGALERLDQAAQLAGLIASDRGSGKELNLRGLVLAKLNDIDGALQCFHELEQLSRSRGDPDGIAASIGNRGTILKDHGDLEAATAAFEEMRRIYERIGERTGVARAVNQLGTVHLAAGRSDDALKCFQEAELLSRAAGQQEGLALALANQANILERPLRRNGEALALMEQAYGIASANGLRALALEFLPHLIRLQMLAGIERPISRGANDLEEG